MASMDPFVGGVALPRHGSGPLRPGVAVRIGDQLALQPGALPRRGRARLARVVGLASHRPESSSSAYATRCTDCAHRRIDSRRRRCQPSRVAPLAPAVLKSVTLFSRSSSSIYFICSVVRSAAGVVAFTQFIVSGVAVVAFFAILEQRTGFNVFDHVRSVFRSCNSKGRLTSVRFGLIRAVGSADHPIALGVLFAMSLPLGLGLASRDRGPGGFRR